MSREYPVVLITGAARRIGACCARRLHAAGYDIAAHCHQSRDELGALLIELESQRPNSTLALQLDLSDTQALPGLIDATLARFGKLNALVNNASSFFATPIGETTCKQWDQLFASNARAPFFLAQAAAPHLIVTRGAIVNLVDIHAERPLRGHAIYSMAKAALAMLTQSLAVELAPNVRVNAIAPGAILWPDAGKSAAEQQALLARTPLQRVGSPQDIADALLWLLSEARYTTGQILRVDGGRSLTI